MCAFIELVKHGPAEIKLCTECGCFLINIQNISMSLDEQGYQEFRKTLHQCMDQSIRKNRPPDVREINMATTLPGLNLLFCRKEVSLLLRLMEMADTKMVNKELITDICDN